MSYLANEHIYRELIESFLSRYVSPDQFTSKYFDQWRKDRDTQWAQFEVGHEFTPEDRALSKILDAIFTACDAYSPLPEGEYEINEEQFRREVRNYASQRWPLPL